MGTLLETSVGVGGVGGGGKCDLVFDLADSAFQSDHFRMYDFKVKRCPRARPHDWTACPFAHPGEKAKRRDPRRYRYSGTACPDFRKTGVCRRGDACPYSHGVFECWLHPSRYRTQMCTDGPSCRRRVCFFAHYEHELRRAEEYPPLLNQSLHAGLVADARALQQQQLAQALSGILGSSAPSLPGGTPAGLESLMNVQLLKTLSQQTPATLLPGESAPATPTGLSGLSPTTTLGNGAGAHLQDSSKLLLQLQMMQQQQQQQQGGQAMGGLHTTVSDASQQSGSSPGGSPRIMAGPADVLTPTAADGARQGSPPVMVGAEEANQLARLIQQQQQQQQAAAAAAGGIDPSLLAALQNLGLGAAAGSVSEGLDASALGLSLASARRSIDNSSLSRPSVGENYLAAAAAALAGGQTAGGSGSGGHAQSSTATTLLNTTTGGSLPTQSFMAAAAAALQRGSLSHSGGASGGQAAPVMEEESTLSLDHILAELPRSASQVNLPSQ